MRTSESIVKISPALIKANRRMGSATKGSTNPFFKTKYADLKSVIEAVKDAYNEFGLTVFQPLYTKPEGHFIETIILHETGEFIASDQLKLELAKTDMQTLIAASTYARRAQLQSFLWVPTADDDGEEAVGRPASPPSKNVAINNMNSTATVTPQPTSKFKAPSSGGLF